MKYVVGVVLLLVGGLVLVNHSVDQPLRNKMFVDGIAVMVMVIWGFVGVIIPRSSRKSYVATSRDPGSVDEQSAPNIIEKETPGVSNLVQHGPIPRNLIRKPPFYLDPTEASPGAIYERQHPGFFAKQKQSPRK